MISVVDGLLGPAELATVPAIDRASWYGDAVFYCPHSPDDHCHCRKPQPGLFEQIGERYGIALTRRFESKLILAALASTRGRRIEAAQKLGIGRNTITRKIQELGLE